MLKKLAFSVVYLAPAAAVAGDGASMDGAGATLLHLIGKVLGLI